MNPIYKRFLLLIAVMLAIAVGSAQSIAQPFRVNWIGTPGAEGLWDAGDAGGGEGDNWETTQAPGNFQPSAAFQEYASISNGGIAVLDGTTTPVTPLDIRLAEDSGSTGSLIIKDSGSITLAGTELHPNEGRIRNGVSAAGAGTVTLHDAIGSVNVDGYTQNGNSTLNVEIAGSTFNPVIVTEQVQLGGTLEVSGALAGAGVGSSWTLFDGSAAGATVGGQFGQVVNNSGYTLGEGQSFDVSTANDSVAVAIKQQLVLRVDPYNGTAVLSNPTGSGVNIDVTGYTMSVSNGSVDDSQWTSFADGDSNWDETVTATQLAETNPTGMATIADGGNQNFGSPLNITTNQPIGTNLLNSVSFQYSTTDNVVENAVVVLDGNRQNNLVLVVDPTDGSATLQNQSSEIVDLTGYVVESDSGALLTGWSDLEGQAVPGWDVVASSANGLAELNAENMSTLGVGETLDLGTLWDMSEQDLTLAYSSGLTTGVGAVFYGDLAVIDAGLQGDFDNDGDVDIVDFGTFGQNFGMTGLPLDPPTDGDFEPDGDVDIVDFGTFAQNFGMGTGSGSAIPEPGSLLLLLAGIGFVGLHSRRA